MKNYNELIIGEWYAPVFERYDQEPLICAFYQFLGNLKFLSESGDVTYHFYDPELCVRVTADGADGFIS